MPVQLVRRTMSLVNFFLYRIHKLDHSSPQTDSTQAFSKHSHTVRRSCTAAQACARKAAVNLWVMLTLLTVVKLPAVAPV